MQSQRGTSQHQQHHQIPQRQRLRLEDRLHRREVDQHQLHQERYRHRREEHPVLRESAVESTVLQRRCEIQENETGEGLKR